MERNFGIGQVDKGLEVDRAGEIAEN